MDILVKGMDMPCMCCLCPCHDWDMEIDRYYCQALKDEPIIVDENTRRDDCPLVEMPTPHGRLIDADKLLSVIERNSYRLKNFYNSCDEGMFLSGIKQAISEAPTIIESEE